MLDYLRDRPYSIRTKLLVAVMFVVLVPLLGTALYGNWFTGSLLKTQAIESAHNELARRAQQIEIYLDRNKNDIRYLAHLYSLNRYIDTTIAGQAAEAERWRTQMEQDLLIFSSAHPDYYQVRYLDETGQEIARVNTVEGRARIVPRSRLQNKAHRYYFVEGTKLGPGDIYISPLDLNREFGQLERPLHPVIRYVTSVYRNGIFRGIIVINVEGETILRFLSPSPDPHTQLLMVDQDGYYLVHPDEAKRWGSPSDLDTGASVWKDFPDVAPQILSGRTGDVALDGRVMIFTPVHYWQPPPKRFWVLVQVEPVNQLLAPLIDFRVTAGLILIVAILLGFIMTYALAQNFTGPVLALQRGVQRLTQGEFTEQLPVVSQDEIGQLTVAFNEMAQMLRAYLDQMDRLQQVGLKISSHVERDEILALVIETIQELLPVKEVTIYCLEMDGEARHYQVAASGSGAQSPARVPINEASLFEASNMPIGQVLSRSHASQAVCYAPLRISASRRAVVEIIGSGDESLDPWHCKLVSTLMAQGSIALENADLYQRLARHREQLQQLVKALITAQEEERRMVAYDIHDGLLQYLVAARLLLHNYASLAEKSPASARELLEASMEQVATAISEGRRIIEGMRPTLLDDLGLAAAVREIATHMAARAGWELSLGMDLQDVDLPPETEIAAFRIIQEALTNAYKYAQGQPVSVRLAIEEHALTIIVQDQGEGFELEEVHADYGHVGLVAMQERARLVGGFCTITSQPGKGVRVFAKLPLHLEEHGGFIQDEPQDSRDHC
ncbi:MAG TPA: HAMP domain-containing protein [Anaerolineae bacterium]|nr:HAMP domain-containing protein [Anaerolineae bacterium]